MEFSNITLDAAANRHQLADRIARANAPRIPSTTYRHLLVQRMRRVAPLLDN